MSNITSTLLISDIKTILHSAKSKVYQTINTTMTQAYYEVGKRIVEEEQEGKTRATYGKALIKNLSLELKQEFGKGFSLANLKNMRQFYLAFEKSQTASSECENATLSVALVKHRCKRKKRLIRGFVRTWQRLFMSNFAKVYSKSETASRKLAKVVDE